LPLPFFEKGGANLVIVLREQQRNG